MFTLTGHIEVLLMYNCKTYILQHIHTVWNSRWI